MVGDGAAAADPHADAPVLYHVADGVARLTLNRPDRLNAINGALSRRLNRLLDQASRDAAVRVILIDGAGRGFCGGADQQVLDEYAGDPKGPNSGSGRLRYGDLMQIPKPVIAAVHGACAGVAAALACCADIRIAAANAFFVIPFARIGLTAEVGLAWLLPRLIGTGNALELLMTGDRVSAARAAELGLVQQVLPDEGFADAALAYANRLAAGSAPTSLAAIKRQVYAGWGQDFAGADDLAARLTFDSLEGPDFAEAMRARKAKRPPAYGGVSHSFLPDR
jgi:enoyl-CoA hydratase/carnithine racemase